MKINNCSLILALAIATLPSSAGFTFLTPSHQTKFRSFTKTVSLFSEEVASEEVSVPTADVQQDEPVPVTAEVAAEVSIETPEETETETAETETAETEPTEAVSTVTTIISEKKPDHSVYVKNIPFEIADEDFKAFFNEYDGLRGIKIPRDRTTGNSRGFAFVSFESEEQLEVAVEATNGKEMDGRKLSVRKSDPEGAEKRKASKGPRPGKGPEGTKVYVGNFPFEIETTDLAAHFAPYGNLKDIYLVKDANGKDKGFGFITFELEEEANNAINGLNGEFFQGRRLAVRPPLPEGAKLPKTDVTRLYFGNLDFQTTVQTVRDLFSEHGSIVDIFINQDHETRESKGFGFCLVPKDEAEAVIEGTNGQEVDGRPIRVTYAAEKIADKTKIYCGNLAFETTEDQVREMFGEYGKIVNLYMPVDPDYGESRGFAIVTMEKEASEAAIEGTNGRELDGRELRVNVAQPMKRDKLLRIYVGNLDFETPAETLEMMFREFGEVNEVLLPEDREYGGSRGFAFVKMSEEEGRIAMEELNGANVDGRIIRVIEAEKKQGGRGPRRAALQSESESDGDDYEY